eukprot:GEMP01083401.1.p3 GENE.GEMP01083401.1~~GEMP01083401.1.p3  ORF type:complete len:106 (+),score=25.98 GEMP01083401.1:79-396(+)
MLVFLLASLCICGEEEVRRDADGGKEALGEKPTAEFDENLLTMMRLYDKVENMLQVSNLEGDEFFMFSSLEPKTAVLWRDVTTRDLKEYVEPEKNMLSALTRGYT